MRTIAFVGPSGTGKSYRATTVSNQNNADAIIDDGILISHGKVLAGSSAKRESTKIASVKHALFSNPDHAEAVKKAIKENNIKCLMILGTSDAMVHKIADKLDVPPIEKIIHIEDIASPEEMRLAQHMRLNQGKHVIPVPTFEIKQDFSGYFLRPLRFLGKNMDSQADYNEDKSIVRPTYSYMGDFTISDNALISIARHESEKIKGITITNINIRKTSHGLHMDIIAIIDYDTDIYSTCRRVQYAIKKNIEKYTSLNIRRVHIFVKNLRITQK